MAEHIATLILHALAGVPSWLRVIVLAMVPMTEFRLAIPIAIDQFHFSIVTAFLLAFVGTSTVFFVFYFFFDVIRRTLERVFPALLKPFDAFLAHARRKLAHRYERYGVFALFLLLVVPIPLTGVWTATFAAVALKIPLKRAMTGILGGLVVGELVVIALTAIAEKAITH